MAMKRKRYPLVALLLTLLAPGLGHLYVGKHLRAVGIYIGWLALAGVAVGTGLAKDFRSLFLLLAALIAWFVYVCVSAALAARQQGVVELRPYNKWYVYALVVLVTGFVGVPILERITQVKAYSIPSGSMEPAILTGDRVYVEKDYYREGVPERGEIAVYFRDEGEASTAAVARIIGLPGETISILKKSVFVDGVELEDVWGVFRDARTFPDELYLSRQQRSRDNLKPFVIPSDYVVVLGDNRDYSYDSRFVGAVSVDRLLHRVLYVYWSRDFGRIGTRLLPR